MRKMMLHASIVAAALLFSFPVMSQEAPSPEGEVEVSQDAPSSEEVAVSQEETTSQEDDLSQEDEVAVTSEVTPEDNAGDDGAGDEGGTADISAVQPSDGVSENGGVSDSLDSSDSPGSSDSPDSQEIDGKFSDLVEKLNDLSDSLNKLVEILTGLDSSTPQDENKEEDVSSSGERGSESQPDGQQAEAQCQNGTADQENAFRASAVEDAGLSEDEADGLNLRCRENGGKGKVAGGSKEDQTETGDSSVDQAENEDSSGVGESESGSSQPAEQTENGDSGSAEQSGTGGSSPVVQAGVPAAGGAVGIGLPEVDQWADQVAAAAEKYGYPDTNFLLAQIKWESQGQPGEISQDSPCGGEGQDSKSVGLFQVTKGCGEGEGLDLLDPATNIDEGVKLQAGNLSDIQQRFPECSLQDQIRMAAAGYVQGYDTITGCNQYSDQRQTDYINILDGFYSGNANAGDGF